MRGHELHPRTRKVKSRDLQIRHGQDVSAGEVALRFGLVLVGLSGFLVRASDEPLHRLLHRLQGPPDLPTEITEERVNHEDVRHGIGKEAAPRFRPSVEEGIF